MAHISTIGAAIYTDLSVYVGTVTNGKAETTATMPTTYDASGFQAMFTTATNISKYAKVPNVREFPAIGAQPNIVNVPVYGQKQSSTVGGQSDAPSLEVTINYVGTDWAKNTSGTSPESTLGNMIGDGVSRIWRFTLLNTDSTATAGATQGKYDSNVGGLGTVQNSQWYFKGRIESLLVTPSLTDATTATIAISVQSDFYGSYTI